MAVSLDEEEEVSDFDEPPTFARIHQKTRSCHTAFSSQHKENCSGGEPSRIVGSVVARLPLPFIFRYGQTYTDAGENSVWVRGGVSGLEKRLHCIANCFC